MLLREEDEAMKPCIFKSQNLCMCAGCVEDGGKCGETVREMNETLRVKYDGKCLSEEEGTDLL